MNNEQPEPRQVLLELLEMYGDPDSRAHINSDMKTLHSVSSNGFNFVWNPVSRSVSVYSPVSNF